MLRNPRNGKCGDSATEKMAFDPKTGKLVVVTEPTENPDNLIAAISCRDVARGGIGGVVNPPTFLELTCSENRVGHSENYGNNSMISEIAAN